MSESSSAGIPDGGPRVHGHSPAGRDDGRPAPDRREEVLEPSAGATHHHAASIRDEQGIHAAGAVPPAFEGDARGGGDDGAGGRRPEDAATGHDTWDGDAAGH
ncbi:hypothetical protein [Arthrobacter sp. TMS1-12-1]